MEPTPSPAAPTPYTSMVPPTPPPAALISSTPPPAHLRGLIMQKEKAVSYTHLTLPTTPYV